jgi:hypothetical protein
MINSCNTRCSSRDPRKRVWFSVASAFPLLHSSEAGGKSLRATGCGSASQRDTPFPLSMAVKCGAQVCAPATRHALGNTRYELDLVGPPLVGWPQDAVRAKPRRPVKWKGRGWVQAGRRRGLNRRSGKPRRGDGVADLGSRSDGRHRGDILSVRKDRGEVTPAPGRKDRPGVSTLCPGPASGRRGLQYSPLWSRQIVNLRGPSLR